jgi:hypothetical protein
MTRKLLSPLKTRIFFPFSSSCGIELNSCAALAIFPYENSEPDACTPIAVLAGRTKFHQAVDTTKGPGVGSQGQVARGGTCCTLTKK